jgi:hypothetical protein
MSNRIVAFLLFSLAACATPQKSCDVAPEQARSAVAQFWTEVSTGMPLAHRGVPILMRQCARDVAGAARGVSVTNAWWQAPNNTCEAFLMYTGSRDAYGEVRTTCVVRSQDEANHLANEWLRLAKLTTPFGTDIRAALPEHMETEFEGTLAGKTVAVALFTRREEGGGWSATLRVASDRPPSRTVW